MDGLARSAMQPIRTAVVDWAVDTTHLWITNGEYIDERWGQFLSYRHGCRHDTWSLGVDCQTCVEHGCLLVSHGHLVVASTRYPSVSQHVCAQRQTSADWTETPPHDDLSAVCASPGLQLVGLLVTSFHVWLQHVFVSLPLATMGSSAMLKLAVQSHFWKSSVIHTNVANVTCNVAGPAELGLISKWLRSQSHHRSVALSVRDPVLPAYMGRRCDIDSAYKTGLISLCCDNRRSTLQVRWRLHIQKLWYQDGCHGCPRAVLRVCQMRSWLCS